jgi:hypothetical protein
MDLEALKDTPPWDWPEGTAGELLRIVRKERAAPERVRVLAIQLAGDFTVINEELVDALLAVLHDSDESQKSRARAAISLGPVLDYMDTEDIEDEYFDDEGELPISAETFERIRTSLRTLYEDAKIPKEVRRRILEASVRAPEDWHVDAIRAAYASDDEAWKLTAVFCMRFVRGFDEQIVKELDSKNADIHFEAVVAAGNWGVEAAWADVTALIHSAKTPKPLLLAAIEAVPHIRPKEAMDALSELRESDDEEIVDAIDEALAMAGEPSEEDEEDEDDLFLA